MILDPEATVICISFMRTPDNKKLQSLLDYLIHPVKQRSYHDMAPDSNEHMYGLADIEEIIAMGETYVPDEVKKQLEQIKKIMDENTASYFRLLKH